VEVPSLRTALDRAARTANAGDLGPALALPGWRVQAQASAPDIQRSAELRTLAQAVYSNGNGTDPTLREERGSASVRTPPAWKR
jgi:hypothetical protein